MKNTKIIKLLAWNEFLHYNQILCLHAIVSNELIQIQ